jgi:acetoin utilization protein AcuB
MRNAYAQILCSSRSAGGASDAGHSIMLMPTIDRYMTRQPWTIASRGSLRDAHALMRDHAIRHLPVVDDGKLVGLVSDGDLRLVESLGGARTMRIRDAMSEPVFTVAASDPIDEVARTLGEHKYGCAVVVTSLGTVAGIFTMVDACRALAELLQRAVA